MSKELIELLNYILPGLITLWLFYGLTSHKKPPQFERIIEALIYTIFIQFFIAVLKLFIEIKSEHEIIFSISIAMIFGVILSYFSNNDIFHKLLRFLKITKQTSYPSEWFGVFNKYKRFIVLNLKDGRRLFGWPIEWPSDPNNGYLLMTNLYWFNNKNIIKIDQIEFLLINTNQIEWIEFYEDVKV